MTFHPSSSLLKTNAPLPLLITARVCPRVNLTAENPASARKKEGIPPALASVLKETPKDIKKKKVEDVRLQWGQARKWG